VTTRWVGIVLVMVGAVSACTGPQMTPSAAEELAVRAAEVRAATGSGSRAVAHAALADLRASLRRLQANGAVEDGKAEDILAAASAVESTLDLMPTTTTRPLDEDHGNGKAKGHGKSGKD